MKFKLFGIIWDFTTVFYISFLSLWISSMVGAVAFMMGGWYIGSVLSAIICAICMATADDISNKYYEVMERK